MGRCMWQSAWGIGHSAWGRKMINREPCFIRLTRLSILESAYKKHLSLVGKKGVVLYLGLSLIILGGILVFGLRPKGFKYSNNVRWIKDPLGIRFSPYAIAYTEPIEEFTKAESYEANGFSIEIVLKPLNNLKNGFNFIAALHGGKDGNQLLMGQ